MTASPERVATARPEGVAAALPDGVSSARTSASRIPDFFIVGHAKCGTTALYEILNAHPQIFMPEYKWGAGKEPWYFSRDNPQPQMDDVRSVRFTGRRAMTSDEYSALFAGARNDQLVGEGSTSYLWSTSAAERIAQARPDARIIAIFREPASFLRSLHLQLLQNHHEEERDFRKAVELDAPRREGREIPFHSYWPQALIYSDRVPYVEQIRRYEKVFAPEQILVLIYDDFRRDNAGTVRRVLTFLGVDEDFTVPALEVNPTIAIRKPRLHRVLRNLYLGRGPVLRTVNAVGKTLTTNRLRRAVYYPNTRRILWGEPPPADAAFMEELRLRYKGEVVALSEHLGRDLVSLWGYEHLG
jgi:Sulfotransferase family